MKLTEFKTPVAIACLILASAGNSIAAEAPSNRCKTFNWSPGDIITIETEMYKQTHIVLPEESLDVIYGTKELWEQAFTSNHIWIKPTTKEPEGKETTVTAIGSSGNSYEFTVKRVANMGSHCAIIKASNGLINRNNWLPKDDVKSAQVAQLQQQLAKASVDTANAQLESKRIAAAAVKSYRSSLYSNYSWKGGSGWFATSGIDTVQDDGRFTYIRLKSDNRGILSVLAEIDGTPEVLEKVYDASKREYKIAGVYPKFVLRAGDSEMTITRGEQ